jgi:hypothetical protein
VPDSHPDNSKRPPGGELFHITPVILGGDPTDPRNTVWLTRAQHIEAVSYWNRVISDLQRATPGPK